MIGGSTRSVKGGKPARSRASEKQSVSLPVLVIEDDPALLEHLCTILENSGYPVVGQSPEADVVRLFSSWRVAGIVMSTQKLNGLGDTDFHAWLSHHRPDLQKKVVFLASNLTDRRSAARPVGWSFLRKPLSDNRFLSIIKKAIGKPPRTERILVVDDEKPIREIMASMLGFTGYRCRTAAGGTQALELLDSGEMFDLVTSDICNVPMDGPSFLEQLRRKFPGIPVLMVTAVHDVSAALACIRNGAYDYLEKPFEREQLVFAVRRPLECRRLKAENDALRSKIARLQRG